MVLLSDTVVYRIKIGPPCQQRGRARTSSAADAAVVIAAGA
ncbi:MAG: hypothetical protein ACI8S6_003605, partial [Myxococcota bacterium]